MKGRILKAWTEQEHEQLTRIRNRIKEMVVSGNTRNDIYDYIAERMMDPIPARVLIYAGIIAGEFLKDKKRILQEEIDIELQEG